MDICHLRYTKGTLLQVRKVRAEAEVKLVACERVRVQGEW